MPNYDPAFFQYVNSGATRSAERVVPLLLRGVTVRSVLDVGCGHGAWLAVWQQFAPDVIGLDGDYVDRQRLLIAPTSFQACDLTHSFDLGRQFDLVQSLEVAEHLPAASAAGFVASLIRHGDLVLFSAAARGQGGDHHINEQDYDYWRVLFAMHDYIPLDYLRPLLGAERDVEPWYRYNTLLYVSSARFEQLPETLRRTRIPDTQPICDVSPAGYRLRKRLTRLLPTSVATAIAKFKERLIPFLRARRSLSGTGR